MFPNHQSFCQKSHFPHQENMVFEFQQIKKSMFTSNFKQKIPITSIILKKYIILMCIMEEWKNNGARSISFREVIS